MIHLKEPGNFGNNQYIKIWTILLDNFETLHREDGPAWIEYYYGTNKIFSEEYYINGKMHRENGPACIFYDNNGNTEFEDYYLDGKIICRNDNKKFQKELEQYIINKIYE